MSYFKESSTGGAATLNANNGGTLLFYNTASAGSGTVNIAGGGVAQFHDTASGGSASFVLSGGTLDISGSAAGAVTVGALMGSSGSVVLGANTLSINQGANTQYQGTISGAGGVSKAGGGDLALYGANTYSGGTTLNAGRLLLDNNAALGTGTLTINGGHIRADNAARTLVNPVAIGGSFEVGQSTTFTGAVSLNADATVTATDATTSPAVFSGVVSGAHSLTKAGPGYVTLSGNNTYSGATAVSGGTLTVPGTNATSGYAVAPGATLDMGGMGIRSGASLAANGTVQNLGSTAYLLTGGATLSGTGTVPVPVKNVTGTVSPGASPASGQIGTLSITGDYTQGAGGIFNLEIASYTSFDKLVVSGNTTLGGMLNVVFLPGFVFTNPVQFDFLTVGGVITGDFQTVNVTGLPQGVQTSVIHGAKKMTVSAVPEADSGLLALLAGLPGVGVIAARQLRKGRSARFAVRHSTKRKARYAAVARDRA